MQIKVWRNPYETGVNITTPRVIELQSGLTVLVGCNGAGKSTLIHNIKDEAIGNKIPYCMFDNMRDGGDSPLSAIIGGCREYAGDTLETGIALWSASEGEAIKLNVSRHSSLYKEFLQSGYFKDRRHELRSIFSNNDDEDPTITDKRRIFLYDATDSGLSIDSVLELKALFGLLLEDAEKQGLECYIIVAANEYEMCRDENCFDVNRGTYITFANYEEYRTHIIKSRKLKEKRLKKEHEYYVKKRERALLKYTALKADVQQKISKIQAKAEKEQRKLTWRENDQISTLQYRLNDFAREHNIDQAEKI